MDRFPWVWVPVVLNDDAQIVPALGDRTPAFQNPAFVREWWRTSPLASDLWQRGQSPLIARWDGHEFVDLITEE